MQSFQHNRFAKASIILFMAILSIKPARPDGLTPTQLENILATSPTFGYPDATMQSLIATSVQANGGDASATVIRAAGSLSPRTAADRAADLLNVMDYGAKCDGITDDTVSLNRVFDAARKIGNGWHIAFPSGKSCLTTSTLNWTNLIGSSNVIDGAGARIISQASGLVAIDALGMRWVRIRDLTLVGDATATPTVGIQIGRYDNTSNQSADDLLFDNLEVIGYFTTTALLDEQAELSLFVSCNFSNSFAGTKSYTAILDGMNHWNAKSNFVQQKQAQNVPQSFLSTQFVNSSFYSYNTQGAPLWLGGVTNAKFSRVYIASILGPVGVEIYGIPGSSNSSIEFDGHFETAALQYGFLITGTNDNPSLDNFAYRDVNPFFSKAIFKLDSGINSVSMGGADIRVDYAANSSVVAFNEPTQWFYTGRFWSNSENLWNLPNSRFRGSYYSGAKSLSSVNALLLPTDQNSTTPIISADQSHIGIQVNTGISATSMSSSGRITGLSISGGGDPNGQWTIGQGVADVAAVSTPYLDFAGHGHGQDARLWTPNSRQFQIQVTDTNDSLVDMFDCQVASGCWFSRPTFDYSNHYMAGTKINLDTTGAYWIQEVNNKVVIGTTTSGSDIRLFSIDSNGNVIAKGAIVGNGLP